MSAHRAVLLVLLVVGGSLAVAAPTSATVDSLADSTEQSDAAESGGAVETDDAAQTDTDARAATDDRFAAVQSNDSTAQNDGANSSLGGDISSFMQSSAAEIDGAVETGMWSAEFNATTDRSRQRRLVERRTDDLRTELNDLQERKQELVAERDAGNVSEAAYKAQVGQLLGRINALKAAINATEPRARQVDTNVDALEMLESDTENLTGPEIAAIARNTTGLGNGSGPPDGVGNGNGSNGVGGPPAGAGNGSGPLEDAGNGSGTGVAGPPAGVGNGTGNGNGTANGNGPQGVPAGNNSAGIGNGTEIGNVTEAGNVTEVGHANGQGPPADAPARGDAANEATGPNAATPAGNGSDESGRTVGPDVTTGSLGLESVSDVMGVRTSTVLPALPFA